MMLTCPHCGSAIPMNLGPRKRKTYELAVWPRRVTTSKPWANRHRRTQGNSEEGNSSTK